MKPIALALVLIAAGAAPALALVGKPFVAPCAAPVSEAFGPREQPLLHHKVMHNGVDFVAPRGTPVVAAAAGKVVYAGWYGGYGKAVLIDHGHDVVTLYGHAEDLAVKSGDAIRQGQMIATVGSTGMTTGYHVHFEVREHGQPVDPAPLLR